MRRKRRDLKELEAEKLRLLEDSVLDTPESSFVRKLSEDSLWNEGGVKVELNQTDSANGSTRLEDDEMDDVASQSGGTLSTLLLDDGDGDETMQSLQHDSQDIAEFYKKLRPQRDRRQPKPVYNPTLRLDKCVSKWKMFLGFPDMYCF